MKRVKFAPHLVEKVRNGTKTSTMRLFDDKELAKGDVIELVNSETSVPFAEAIIVKAYEKTLGEVTAEDFDGNEPYTTKEALYASCREYYGKKVTNASPVKFIHYKIMRQVD